MWIISSLPPFKFHVITKSCLSQVIKISGIVGVFLSYSCNRHSCFLVPHFIIPAPELRSPLRDPIRSGATIYVLMLLLVTIPFWNCIYCIALIFALRSWFLLCLLWIITYKPKSAITRFVIGGRASKQES